MINLVSREERDLKRINKMAGVVRWVTTLGLIIYIAAISWLGWRWIEVVKRSRGQSDDEKRLVQALAGLADTEVLLRQVDLRGQLVSRVIRDRVKAGEKLKQIVNWTGGVVELVGWTYGGDGTQTLIIRSINADQIEGFVGRVSDEYRTVKMMEMVLGPEASWEAKLVIGESL